MIYQRKGEFMELNEFKDRLFDILNETDDLPIADIIFHDRRNEINILLDDHSSFIIKCLKRGSWFLHWPDRW